MKDNPATFLITVKATPNVSLRYNGVNVCLYAFLLSFLD
jgi:hypothetical protein